MATRLKYYNSALNLQNNKLCNNSVIIVLDIPPTINWRLPTDLYPRHYDLTIQPYFRSSEEPMNYDGKVRIRFECMRDTNKLVFHSSGLSIDNASLAITNIDDFAFPSFSNFPWTYDSVTSQVTIQLTGGRMFKAGRNYMFSASYTARASSNNLGFYKSRYTDADGTYK